MLWNGNQEEDPTVKREGEQINSDSNSGETGVTQRIQKEVNTLREKIDLLKATRDDFSVPVNEKTVTDAKEEPTENAKTKSTRIEAADVDLESAKIAVLKQAIKDRHEEVLEQERQRQREAQMAIDQREVEEAQRRAAEKKREAQRLRQIKIDAERHASAIRKQEKAETAAARNLEKPDATVQSVFEQPSEDVLKQKRIDFERRRREDQERLVAQQRRLLEQQRKMLEEEKRKETERKRKAEERQRKEQALERKRERQKLIEEERRLQRERREQADEEIRKIRAEQEAQRRAERKERARRLKAERAEKAEIRRQKKLAKHSAELGGGIVNVHGMEVKTEIAPVAAFTWRDLLGITTKGERKAAASEEELKELLEETERKKEEARLVAAKLAELRRTRRQNSEIGKKFIAFRDFCDAKKKPLLIAFACVLMFLVGVAGIFNFFTVYEYSYNGKTLGYVNNKDNVLKITGLVQQALTEDIDLSVVIDAKKDIDFKRVTNFNNELTIDTSDDVLRRLTYMGDLNVKAYGIYIDGKKIGSVVDKETAAKVLQDIKDKYSSNKKGSQIEEAVIVEDIQVRRANSDLEDILDEKGMVDKLCTSGNKETVHKVIVGETLADIANDYGTTEKQIESDNPGINPKKLVVGSSLAIKTKGPVMTVKITEVRTYDKTIKYKTIKKKDKKMYEGYSEIDQEGKNGKSRLTDRTVSINGEVIETQNLETSVLKEPVEKIMRIGTKDRPPTVGSGKFIWPAKAGTYTVTSEFKWRWGRHHDGMDLACSQGNIVMAADGGTVTYAGYMGGYGLLVIIDHQNGMESYYGHNSNLTVNTGDKVFQGQQIAYSGNTGHSTGPHIHFGIKVNGTWVNPRDYVVE